MGRKGIKVKSRFPGAGQIGVIDSIRGHGKVSPTAYRRPIEKLRLFPTGRGPTVNGYTPESWNIAALRIIKKFSVWRRNGREASVVGDLRGGSSFRSDLPDFPGTAAIGRKI